MEKTKIKIYEYQTLDTLLSEIRWRLEKEDLLNRYIARALKRVEDLQETLNDLLFIDTVGVPMNKVGGLFTREELTKVFKEKMAKEAKTGKQEAQTAGK